MKSLLKLLGISMIVMGLFAMSATAAHAVKFQKETPAVSVITEIPFTAKNNGIFKLSSGPVVIICKKMTAGGEIRFFSTSVRKVKFIFTECEVIFAEEEAVCDVVEPIETENVEGTLKQVGEFGYVDFKPEAGGEAPFVTIEFTGEECAIGGISLPVSGTACAKGSKVGTAFFAVEQPLISPAGEACPSTLKLGEEKATLEGEGLTKLVGALGEGDKWGAIP